MTKVSLILERTLQKYETGIFLQKLHLCCMEMQIDAILQQFSSSDNKKPVLSANRSS